MKLKSKIITAILAAAAIFHGSENVSAAEPVAQSSRVKNIVLVHGAFADGSGWRGVYDELTRKGYRVTVVQNPLTSLEDDVAATRRAIARQDGPTIVVGHSYGGTVITEAGVDEKVVGLVYVSALAPDVGESTGDQFVKIPAPPEFVIETGADGFGFLNLEKFKLGFANDTSDADAAFLRDSQVPINMANFGTKVTHAAWRSKPSWFIVATQDNAISPKLLRKQAERIGAEIIEIEASHVPFVTKPKEVAAVIEKAALNSVKAAK